MSSSREAGIGVGVGALGRGSSGACGEGASSDVVGVVASVVSRGSRAT